MLNVIFRHRERMAIVYGRVSPLPLAGERFRTSALEREALAHAPRAPGQLGFRGRHFLLRPLPPRVDRRRAG